MFLFSNNVSFLIEKDIVTTLTIFQQAVVSTVGEEGFFVRKQPENLIWTLQMFLLSTKKKI